MDIVDSAFDPNAIEPVKPRVQSPLTLSIARWNAGDLSEEPALMRTIYPMLRAMAQSQIKNLGPITLQATELANEMFIKLRVVGAEYVQSKGQFMNFMARMLRNLVVDYVRERGTQKRGGDVVHVRFSEAANTPSEEPEVSDIDWVALDIALTALEAEGPDYARLVELRYYLGYSIEECAVQLERSTATVNRMWRFARVFLSEKMRKS
jgi:RNA polymerase sigma factor (TIGR02999 family)